jgi:hypothetical protein
MASWNYTAELAPFTNLTWIHVGTAADEPGSIKDMLVRLREAKLAGVKAVLSIEPFLFRNERGDPRPDPELEDFLVELRAQLEFAGLVDTLAMIYPKDEPFREFVDARNPNFIEQYVTGEVYEDIHRDLKQVNAQIKLVFPEKPIGVILSGYELFHKFFSIPENYDWVGFDCYDNLFKACDDRSFVQAYRHLLDHMQPQQKLMAVPETWATNQNLERADWPQVLSARLLHHYEMVLNEPRFVAFIPFIWSFDAPQETPGLGLNRFGELYDLGLDDAGTVFVNLVKDIGLQVKQGAQQYPNLAWYETEDHSQRAPSSIRGELMSISDGGVLSAWAVDDALPHKSLRMRVLVRDAAGNILHKSRFVRSNVDDPGLRAQNRVGKAFVGLHGFRYQLPSGLLKDNRLRNGPEGLEPGYGQDLVVDLLVYSDGPGADGMGAELAKTISMPLPALNQLHLVSTQAAAAAEPGSASVFVESGVEVRENSGMTFGVIEN